MLHRFTTAYTWNRTPWKPSLNIGLDLASGDDDPTDGRNQTFDQLFPLAHAYLGHIDLVARQNIRVARLQFGLNPRKRFTCVLFYHWFELDSPRDALYNAGAIPIRRDPTGASGREVATELDVLWTWNFAKNHFVGAEIMRWWSGSFIEATGDPDDAWRAWLGYELRY